MSRRHPPEQCGGTDDSETHHCSLVSFLSRTLNTVIAMALAHPLLTFCWDLPLVSPGMSTLITVCFLECTSRCRHASDICACPDVASASNHQKQSVVAARAPHWPPNYRAGAPKEAPRRHFTRHENALPRACSGKGENAQKTGSGQRSGQLFSCPSEMSESVRAMGIGAKIAFFHASKNGGQDKGQDKSRPFWRETSIKTTCPVFSRCGVLILYA